MTLSKDQKQKLKKLNSRKYNPVKGIETSLFMLWDEKLSSAAVFAEPISIHYKLALSPSLHKSCMAMFEENMGALYKKSSWGLDLKEREEELSHNDARFLLVMNTVSNEVMGYCHFRFDTDDEDDPTQVVVYVFELQVGKSYRRYGMGQRLMEIVHRIARNAGLTKVMLTVFTFNEIAQGFYKKLGYVQDETSPAATGEESDYEILSKSLS
jgi:GNAT superfamily N-acetyltransferase